LALTFFRRSSNNIYIKYRCKDYYFELEIPEKE
jgi:hypothetical protein